MNLQPPGGLAQGDTRLPGTPVAKELPAAAAPAYPAYTGLGGSARNTRAGFHRTGPDLILGAFAGTSTTAAPRTHPAVAVTAATHHPGATVLSPRGEVTWADVDGPLEKSAIAPRKTPG